jgi:DNA topoisomerase-1
MIVDREREIQNFVPQEYWIIEVNAAPPGKKEASFKARLFALADGTRLDIGDKDEADRVISDLEKATYTVKVVVTKQVARQPAPPFITSTLQQEAWQKLHFTAGRTMAIDYLYAHRFYPCGCLCHKRGQGVYRREIRSQIPPTKTT